MRGISALLVGLLAVIMTIGPVCEVADAGLRPRTWGRRPIRRVLSAPFRGLCRALPIRRGAACSGGSCAATFNPAGTPACACVREGGFCECSKATPVQAAAAQPDLPDAGSQPPADYSLSSGGAQVRFEPALPQELPAAAGAGRFEPALP